MASSLNGPTAPHCSIASTKPAHIFQNPHRHHNQKHHHNNQQFKPNHKVPVCAAASAPSSSGNHSLSSQLPSHSTGHLGAEFCGRKSTRVVSKFHLNRPKTGFTRKSSFAEPVLEQIFSQDNLEEVLSLWEFKLVGPDDYTFIIRELGNRGDWSRALRCFHWAIARENRTMERGKLVSVVISSLGRLHRVDLAKQVFDSARTNGCGNSVYVFSALISAYGRSGFCKEAIRVFESMKAEGFRPNLVTYNAVIDACGKGGVGFERTMHVFDEMVRDGVQPDRITFNSLLAVCSRGGSWEKAMNTFEAMRYRGIQGDIFTYNTLLDAVCKGGQMDSAANIMAEMVTEGVWPNVVSYSTVIDGFAKASRLEEALNLVYEMKNARIALDRVCYNTLLSIYVKMGRFDDAIGVCREMENCRIRKDVVTYNALLGGYAKQGKYDMVKRLIKEMKVESIALNVLTYSTLIDSYCKGGLHREAMEVFGEFKEAGLKADVVLYSALVDALCKNGLVESAVMLLDEMTREGIRPNVVTYNSIIDAFGRSSSVQVNEIPDEEGETDGTSDVCEHSSEVVGRNLSAKGSRIGLDYAMKIFENLAIERGSLLHGDTRGKSRELLCILGVFHKMHELDIKPNVVTFSAILNACSRCNSFEDASMLLEELRLFDNHVYGVAHGLLMGLKDKVWVEAQDLFDEVKQMDSSTASAFYNALTDMLWHFGQRQGAKEVVLEGKRRQVWENAWSESCLDLHLMSAGAAQAMVHAWLLSIHEVVFDGHELPKLLSILTGWGKHSKVAGDGTLRRSIEGLLSGLGAPFSATKFNVGRLTSTGALVGAWLRESGTLKLLILHDHKNGSKSKSDQPLTNLQLVPL